MCYYTAVVNPKGTYSGLESEFALRYGHEEYADDKYLLSGFDSPEVPIITADHEFKRYRWGLIPSWCKDWAGAVKMKSKTLNAVGDTVDVLSSFRGAVKHGRFCIVPVSGFYDFHHLGNESYPFYIYPKSGPRFLLGGIYEHWTDPATNERFDTYSIVTTEANKRMSWIHNKKKRMPFILSKQDAHLWLDKELPFVEKKKLIVSFDQEQMADYPVKRFLKWSRDRRESKEVLEKTEYPELALDI